VHNAIEPLKHRMTTSATDFRPAVARTVAVTGEAPTVHAACRRRLSVPLAWYSRLLHGSSSERRRQGLTSASKKMRSLHVFGAAEARA
jgi:hypothetical protein